MTQAPTKSSVQLLASNCPFVPEPVFIDIECLQFRKRSSVVSSGTADLRTLSSIDYLQNGVYQSTGSALEPNDLQTKDYDRIVRSLKGSDECSESPC
jgi:hypothetical protein